MLIPIIAIMLGYAAISGDAESGSLAIVLAYPVRKVEVLLGKFIGLGSVLGVSTTVGFGTGGIVIALVSGTGSWKGYLAFIALSTFLGLLYLSLSMFFSALCAKRVTSLGAGVLIFFWGMIYGTVLFGIYLATGGTFEGLMSGKGFPDWMWWSILVSPNDTNQMTIMQAFGIKQAFGVQMDAPGFMSLGLLVTVQLIWTIVPLLLAYYFFEKRDI